MYYKQKWSLRRVVKIMCPCAIPLGTYFPEGNLEYIMVRGQLSMNQEGKYTCTRNLSPPLLPTHLVLSHCLYPFDGDNLGITRLHRSPGLHSSPSTTSLDTIFTLYDTASSSTSCDTLPQRVRRILHISYCTAPFVGYNTASSSPLCTAQLRRVHLTLHDSKARVFVKGKRATSRGGGEE